MDLMRACIDRHTRLDEISANFGKFNPDQVDNRFMSHDRPDISGGIGFEPHGPDFLCLK